MSGFLLSPAAHADLAEIWDYTADRWGVEQAEHYIRELTNACQGLADKRLQGRAIDASAPGIPSCLSGRISCATASPT